MEYIIKEPFFRSYLKYQIGAAIRIFLITALPLASFTVTFAVTNSLNWKTGDSVLFASGALLAMLFVSSVTVMLYFKRYVYGQDKYTVFGELIKRMNNGFSYIHGLRKSSNETTNHAYTALSKLCDELKRHFEEKTNTKCSVAIITLTGENGANRGEISKNATLYEFSRDSEFNKKRAEGDKDTVLANTPFSEIADDVARAKTHWEKREVYYYNQDVNSDGKYLNSYRGKFPGGKLPYSSELITTIMPIQPNYAKDEKGNSAEVLPDIVGFISVDCKRSYQLKSKYDIDLLRGTSDGIYDIIAKNVTLK